MVAVGICGPCRDGRHCQGKSDRKVEDEMVGGFRCTCSCRTEEPECPKT